MKRMGWVVLALVAVLFVSCSKEGAPGPAGPSGTQGSTGATGSTGSTGAAGTPRRMYIESRADSGTANTNFAFWSAQIILPWTPAANGVIANYRGFITSNGSGYVDGGIYDVTQSGQTATVSGWIFAENYPYNYYVYYDVIAYDTFTTVLLVNKTRPGPPMLRKTPTSIAKTTLP